MSKKFHIDDFMKTIGLPLSSVHVQDLLKKYQLPAPAEVKDLDDFWIEKENLGLALLFKDEGEINHTPYADIGDGDLVFIAAFFERIDLLELPFGISPNDDKDTVLRKMPRKPDKEIDFLNDYIWLMESPFGKPFMFSIAFDPDFKNIFRVSISYVYDKIEWIEELKNK